MTDDSSFQLAQIPSTDTAAWRSAEQMKRRTMKLRAGYLERAHFIDGDLDESAIAKRVARRSFARRLFDVVGALLLLVPGLPVMLLAALAIRLEDGGPCFYRQERVGWKGRPFLLLKLRTMQLHAEADGQPRWASHNDPRVTSIGRRLRHRRIDELPQLFNVLRGEMSLIGPRPERPCFVETLERELPGYALRHYTLPGLTGYAHVEAGYTSSVAGARAKLACDLYYLLHQSLRLDLQILARTVPLIVTGRGAR